jgi:hypothetical protein
MWVFYALAGPIALGMVVATLQYFAASTVPLHARWIVGYAWFCTISIIILVPADIWSTVSPQSGSSKTIGILWSWSYWSTFILTWYVSGMVFSLFWLFLLMVHNTHKPWVRSWMHWILSVGLLHLMFVFELFHNGFHHFSRIQTVGILFIFGCGVNRRL